MNKILIFLFVFFLSISASFGQINAYYDAVELSRFSATHDTTAAANQKVLSILATYFNKNKTFSTKEVTDIYTTAIKNLFSLETLFNWFKNNSGSNDTTRQLGRYVKNYEDLNENLNKNDSTSKAFAKRFLLLKPQFSDSTLLHDTAYHKKMTDTLVSFFKEFPGLKKTNQNLTDSALHILQTPSNTLQLLQNINEQQIINYSDSSEKLSHSLSAKTAQIQDFFANNFSHLDKDLKGRFKKSGKDAEQITNLNIASASAFSQDNNTSNDLYQKNETASLTNFKLPSQTEMIDALAIFLAKRFKQEVALTLVDQFRKTLKNDKLLNDLFPETYKMFSTGQLFEMPSFGSAWNYAISKDFNNMLFNLSRSSVIKDKIGDSALVTHLQNIISLSTLINKRYSYVDAISQMYFQNASGNFFGKNIKSLYIINKELFDTGKASQFWINSQSLYSLNDRQLNLFFALLKEKYNDDLGIINSADLTNAEMKPRIRIMLSGMLVLLNNFQASRRNTLTVEAGMNNIQISGYWDFLTSLFQTLQTQWQDPPPYVERFTNVVNNCFETYSMLSEKNYSGAALKLMDLLPEIRDNHYVDLEAICFSSGKIQKIVASSDYVRYKPIQDDIYKLNKLLKGYLADIDLKKELDTHAFDYRYLLNDQRVIALQQKYANLKLGADFKSNLLSMLSTDSKILRKKIDSSSTILQKEISSKNFAGMEDIRIDSMTNKIVNGTADKYITQSGSAQFESIRKVTGFLSDMVLAGNSKNLSQVIEKYALPPNSYKIKRHTRSSWDINAYVGAYLGAEMLTSGKSSISPVYGFSAPVGVSHSWGKTISAKGSDETVFHTRKGDRVLKGNSFTVDLSLIDIGAVVSYRLTNDASKGLPQQVKWSQIISPGLHFRWGIKETPICFSAGIQNTPQLRKLNDTSPPVSAVRLYAGFFFDIPLINISYR